MERKNNGVQLKKINGHTYYIPGATNTGVYTTKNGSCLLIDSGINNTVARKIRDTLVAGNLKPKYLLTTHGHADHFGAHHLLQQFYPGLQILASPGEKPFMADSLLGLKALYGAIPFAEIKVPLLYARSVTVDADIDPGPLKLLDQRFQAVATPGHSAGHLAFLTPDGVLFSGDAVYHPAILAKYPLPFLQDVGAGLTTLASLADLEIKYLLPAHSPEVITDPGAVWAENRRRVNACLEKIATLLARPLTREELLAELARQEGIPLDMPQYFLNLACISAFISYLKDHGRLACALENGRLYFFAT